MGSKPDFKELSGDAKWYVVIMKDKTVIREDPFEDYFKAKRFFESHEMVDGSEGNARLKLRDRAGTTFMQSFVAL